MKVYIFFKRMIQNKVEPCLLWCFSTEEKAITAANENDSYSYQSEVVIIECDVDKFEEL